MLRKILERKDGYLAYQELVKWYEGDELTTEMAEDVRAKMDKLKLWLSMCSKSCVP